jgi:hypothetical protein
LRLQRGKGSSDLSLLSSACKYFRLAKQLNFNAFNTIFFAFTNFVNVSNITRIYLNERFT